MKKCEHGLKRHVERCPFTVWCPECGALGTQTHISWQIPTIPRSEQSKCDHVWKTIIALDGKSYSFCARCRRVETENEHA
jgi:hypothetical protein